MRPCLRTVCLVVALLVAAAPLAARAGGGRVAGARLHAAKADYANLSYARALAEYRRALRAPDITGPQTFQALLGEGWCLVILGHGARARHVLARALRMNPGWTPPPDLSPKLAGAVHEARAGLHLAKVSLSVAAVPGGHGEIAVTARDPGHRVARVVLSVRLPGGAWQTPALEARGADRWVARVPAGAGQAVDAAAEAENRAGFAIAHTGSRSAPKMLALPAPAKAAATPHPSGRHVAAHPAAGHTATAARIAPHPAAAPARPGAGLTTAGLVTGGAAVVGLGVATYFEVEAQNEAALYNGDPSKLGSSSHAQQVGADAVQNAGLATGFYIGGGALAVSAGVLLLLGHDAAAPAPAGPDLSVAPLPGGAMVVATGRLPF